MRNLMRILFHRHEDGLSKEEQERVRTEQEQLEQEVRMIRLRNERDVYRGGP